MSFTESGAYKRQRTEVTKLCVVSRNYALKSIFVPLPGEIHVKCSKYQHTKTTIQVYKSFILSDIFITD